AIGLTVTDAEVRDAIERGTDPILAGTPFNDENGKFDADILKNFLAFYQSLDKNSISYEEYSQYESMYKYWLFIENDIKTGLLYTKYISLVKASIVSNPVAAKNSFENRIKRADVLMASIPFTSVPDADVNLTKSDIKKVYDENKESMYTYSENRDIYYIDYEIEPSQADRDALKAEVNEIATQLEDEIDDYAAFLRRSGSEIAFSEVARSAKNLPEDVAERLDSVNVGGVFGPYYSEYDDTYNAFKFLGTVNGYDSIQVQLMQVVMSDEAAADKRVDSILTALKKGASFEAIAESYGQMASEQWLAADSYEPATISGDNAAYLNKINSMKKGESSSLKVEGGIIIIKILDNKTPVKKYDLAIVKRPVEFSEQTSNDAYNKLSLFVAQNSTIDELKENAEDSDFRLLYYPGFENYSYNVGGVAKSHEALRWVFSAEKGEVSRIFEVGNANDHLLVVAVDEIHPRGYRSVDDATQVLSLRAIKDKKSDVLKDKLAGLSFEEIKAIPEANIDTVKFLNFTNSAYIASVYSNEPTLGPSVMNLEQGKLTVPMVGENCVYVAEKISADEYSAEFDEKAEKARLQTISVSQIPGQILDALYYEAKVVDNRYKIF
ncbi:MAG: peptidyl-prolyl cis-trans isomerase, partial [Bacteroidaceae bacterium]|nr:peptidyl-prolyl cis-trans isomerase [Bacteroidaceae bacterium]